jgi:glycolate oxidase
MLAVTIEATVKLVPKPKLARCVMVSFDDIRKAGDAVAAAILLCESDGTPEEEAEEIDRMLDVLSGAGATRLEVSKDEAQRLTFCSGRKDAFPASGRISPEERTRSPRAP